MFKRRKNKQADETPPDNLLDVYETDTAEPIARVVLNGYNIDQENSFGRHGAMCSFKIVEGDLWHEWHWQHSLTLREPGGNEAPIKVTALPVDNDSYGIIEFV